MLWLVRPWHSGAAIPAGVFLFGVLLASVTGLTTQRDIDAGAQAEFRRSVERVTNEIERRLQQPIFGLNGAKGVYAVRGRVSRSEFRAYVAARGMDREFRGVRGFGFIERVPREGQAAFVAVERADAAPGFTIRQLDDRSQADLLVIKFIEPPAANAGAQGLDIGSEPRRRAAAQRAIDTGEPSLSAAVTLVQDQRRTAGALLYVPVYEKGAPVATVDERRAGLVGLLYAPLVIAELLEAVHDVASHRTDFELFDAAEAAGPPLYVSGEPRAAVSTRASAPRPARFELTQSLAAPGREFRIHVTSTPEFEASFARSTPWLVFAGGVALSALLALLLWQQAGRRRRAEALAQRMTRDLERLAQVARGTSNAVTITDRDLRIRWVNEGFTRVTGYTFDEALGRTPGELLSSGKASPQALQQLTESARTGAGCRVEVLNRAKDGREYWIDTEVQPIHDAAGRLTGFMEIGSDVTAQRQAHEQLEAALRDNDALLRTIDMHAIVSVADRAGRITEVNQAFCRISGYPRDELIGQNHRIVNSGLQPSGFWNDMWACVASGTPWRAEVCNRAKDGSLYWVDTIIAPFAGADGRIDKYISIRTDITASKNAKRALANIIEGTNVGTWEWNVATGEAVINERWAQLVGCTREELAPVTGDTWRRLSHPDDFKRSSELLRRHFSGQQPDYECEARLRHKDGHWVWLLGRGKLFSRDAGGAPQWMAGTHMDISERKHAELALRESQNFLDKTGRIGGVGGWELDLATLTVLWTDQTCRIHDLAPGHRPTLEQAIGYYAPEGRSQIERAVQHAIASGAGFDLELPLVTATGRAIWVRAVGEAEFVEGQAVRLLGAFQDITQRRTMEADLRRHNEVLHSVLESLPCGLSVFDAERNLVAANTEFRRLLDLPDALFEAESVHFEDLVRFNAQRGEYGDAADLESIVRARMASVRAPLEAHQFERIRPNGLPLEMRGAPMPGGGVVTTYTDISERRNAEAEVRRSAELLRGAIDAIDEAFVLYGPDDRLVLCNEKYRQVYPASAELIVPGVSFEELVRHGALSGQYADAVGRVDEWVAERMAAHRAGNSTLVQRQVDGRSLRIVERKMPDGHTVGFRIDITEVVRATEAAQEASRAKTQFLANMSHEIRTPMNAILGMLALLRRTALTARQADYAAKTESAARSLLGLLNDILDFSKAEAGRMLLDPHPFDIESLLSDLAVILAGTIGRKDVELLFDIDPALPRRLVGDAMRLQQVLVNLAGNALKFTAEGEVVVSIAVLQNDARGATLRVAVRDTGIGIAPENQARIFSGFTQAEASTTRRYGGTGLGVAISQRFVALMGGQLALESALGAGSCFHFTVTLPLAPEAVTGGLPVGAPGSEPGTAADSALRVLIVDDHAGARLVLGRVGEARGWPVDRVSDGPAALALLQQHAATGTRWRAIFVDWQLPGMDSWTTCRHLRDSGLAKGALLVAMVTAHGREALAERAETEPPPFDTILVKPITPSMWLDAADPTRGVDVAADHSADAGATASGRRLGGLRLLVVEDNPNNQQVARELLEGEGAQVVIAAHGGEALACIAAAQTPFDVVLMDLQMPVMDGLTATHKIRTELGLPALPIIAMTANAMASDRETCLAAGMNDHVGKPFDLDHLVRVVHRHVGRREATEAVGETNAHAAVERESGPALGAPVRAAAAAAGVDLDAALRRLGGNASLYRRMLQRFTTDLQTLPAQLQGLLDPLDAAGAARLLHTLKGLAATLGVGPLAAAAAAGEAALTVPNPEPNPVPNSAQDPVLNPAALSPEILAHLVTVLDATLPALAALLQALPREIEPATPAAAPAIVDTAAFQAGLRTLLRLLRDSDMAALEAASALQRHFAGELGPTMQSLDEAIGGLDFDRAVRLCEDLLAQCGEGPAARADRVAEGRPA